MQNTRLAIALSLLAAATALVPGFVNAQQAATPIQAGGVTAIDIPATHARALSIEIKDGEFASYSIDQMKLTANNIDFRDGKLDSFDAALNKGHFDNILVDQMNIHTSAFSFDTFELLNHQRFVLDQPITGQVNLRITEQGLNHFLGHPKTLSNLEKAIAKKTGGIKLISFANPQLDLLGGNAVKLTVTGMLGEGVPIPLEMTGRMQAEKGLLAIRGLKLSSGGSELQLPVDVASVFEEKLNDMINLQKIGKKTFIIKAETVAMGKDALEIHGNAVMTRLEFGK